jgi:hypothetical protein
MQTAIPTNPAYMRNAGFDRLFVLGIPAIALAAGALVINRPDYFLLVLTLDLALLGYHHVISTYTRLLFDLKSARQHWALLLPLPLAVFAAVLGLGITGGVAAITTVYMHWQFYHYTRQSEGINKAYGMKTRSVQGGHAGFNRLTFYLVPVAAFLAMSARPDATFLGTHVWKLPVPVWLAQVALAAAGACLLWWLVSQLRALRAGTLGWLHFAYLCSHHVIYVVSYALISDITQGWIVINIWHNTQYIAFVWLFNSNRFKGGVERDHLAVSWLSQERNWLIYLLACLALTGLLYGAIGAAANWFEQFTVVPLALVCYQVLNFHHYIVDSLIWKLRKPAVQASLHIA